MSEKQNSSTEFGYKTASDKAYEIISKKILSGEFRPGERLSRRNMAKVTGVSVIPVIEALKKLEEDHLVESKPQWGSFVAVPTEEKIRDSYQLREALECEIVRILSKSIKPTQLLELEPLAEYLDTTVRTDETKNKMEQIHFEFHQKLAEYSGNELILLAMQKVNLFSILAKATMQTRPNTPCPRYWHRKILDSIKEGNPEKAEIVMREHIYDKLNPMLEGWDND